MKTADFFFFIFICCVILLLTSCQYEDDFTFMSDARANYFSEEVTVNNYLCKDITGAPGACSIQIPNNLDLTLKLAPRPYEYRVTITCSSKLGFEVNTTVLENTERLITIPKDKIAAIDSFTCIGEVFPQDRPEAVSMKFEVRTKVYNAELIKLDEPRIDISSKGKADILVGIYAKHTKVCNSTDCEFVQEKYRFKSKLRQVRYIKAESASGRLAYWGQNGI